MNIIVIEKKDERFWRSCDQIEIAFKSSLAHLASPSLNIDFYNSIEQVPRSEQDKCTHIIFLSHNTILEKELAVLNKRSCFSDPELIIPIYGDMTTEVRRWRESDLLLRDKKVKLLAASVASLKQISALCHSDIFLVPYPVITKSENSLPEAQTKNSDNITLIYAGRIAHEKNILQLISDFNLAATINNKLTLKICGNFSFEGRHFFGTSVNKEKFKDTFHALVSKAPNKVQYLGDFPEDELMKQLNAADYFISMSTYHDEDYGYACAQASIQGTPSILSHWGGHKDKLADFIELKTDRQGFLNYNSTQLIKQLSLLEKPSFNERKRVSDMASRTISTRAVSSTIAEVLNAKATQFRGMSELFHQYAELFADQNGTPFKNHTTCSKTLKTYQAIYRGYGALS